MSKILIIEDDNFLLEMLSVAGTQEGFNIEIATDGEAGLEKIRKGNFDIVLLDLILPKLHGLELLKELRAENNMTPIVVLSNLYDQESADTAKSFGVKDYIIKAQSTPQEIIQKIKILLSEKDKMISE
jgi:DNA-binding response OmpR family regulator